MKDLSKWRLRRHHRSPLECPVSVKVVAGGTSQTPVYHGVIRNISAGGLFLEIPNIRQDLLPALVSKQYSLHLEFQLPDEEITITATAELVWLKQQMGRTPYRYGLALSFRAVDSDARQAISRFVRNQELANHIPAENHTESG